MTHPRWLSALLCLWLLPACHDARRQNPLDPALTPQVSLQVSLDDTAGTATLTWTRYEGDQPFAAYRVLRKVQGLERVDTLAAAIAHIDSTNFVDATVSQGTVYQYRVTVLNTGGYETPAEWQTVGPLHLPGVQIDQLTFDSPTASATLSWTPYRGPRFAAYQVLRRVGADTRLVAELADTTAVSLVDTGLTGNTEYAYRVVSMTEAGEQAQSEEATGGFHRLLATWPLELAPGLAHASNVRLYDQPGDRIAALASSVHPQLSFRGGARWTVFSSGGELLQTQLLIDQLDVSGDTRSFAAATDTRGQLHVAYQQSTIGPQNIALRQYTEDSRPVHMEQIVLNSASAVGIAGAQGAVLGELSLGCAKCAPVGEFRVDNLVVTSGGSVVLAEDFESLPDGPLPSRWQDWQISGDVRGKGGWLTVGKVGDGVTFLSGFSRLSGLELRAFELDLDLVIFSAFGEGATAWIGGGTLLPFQISLDTGTDRVRLDWSLEPSASQGLEPTTGSTEGALDLLPRFPYHLRLESLDGQLTARVSTPVVWHRPFVDTPSWASLAAIGDVLALTVDGQPLSLSPQGDSLVALERRSFEGWVGETRVWQDEAGRTRVGVCLPGEDQVKWGTVLSPAAWDANMNTTVGPRLAGMAGSLYYPLSLDGGSDGRVYVLDAGSARILSFDAQGRYITQWGRRGTGDGEFDFGDGTKIKKGLNLTGSVAVDEDGFIYVADTRRIQRL